MVVTTRIKEVTSNKGTRDRVTGKISKGQKFSNLLKICRIDHNRFFSIDI